MSLSKFAREISKGVASRSKAIFPSAKTLLAPSSTLLKPASKLLVTRGTASGGSLAFKHQKIGPHIVSDVDAWANDDAQTIIPQFATGEPGWNPEDVTIDCSGMDLRRFLVNHRAGPQRIDDGSVSTDSAPGVGKGGSTGGGSNSAADKDFEFKVEGASAGFQGEIDQGLKTETEVTFDKASPGLKPLIDQINETMEKQGVVYLTNTGLKTGAEMKAAMYLWDDKSMQYQGGANYRGVNPEHPNVYETGAPSDAWIHYHHEMAYVKESMIWVGFCCINGTWDPMKGATYVSNQEKVTEELLSTDFGQKLKDKGVCYVRKLPDRKYFIDNNLDTSIVYNYWQTSFRTEDPDECVKLANQQGLDCEWQDSPIFGRYLVTKFYVDNYEYFPKLDKNVCYASVADDYMWFDKWNGVKNLPHHERPLKLNFGDDEIMTKEEKQQFVDVYDKHGMAIPWKKGDVALCCNYRTAHGRPPYELKEGEKRDLGVVLGRTYPRVGQDNAKW